MRELDDKPWLHCPGCGTVIELHMRCVGVRIVPTDEHGNAIDGGAATPQDTPTPGQRKGTEAEQDVIAAARRAGLLEPFEQAVQFVKRDQVPKDMEGFFLTFLRSLHQKLIPSYAMDEFNRLFDYRPLEYHSSQGIGVVIVDGYMRLFVPDQNVVGTRLRKLNNQSSKTVKRVLKIDDGKEKLREWIHTRWGYVASDGALLDHLRKRSFGEFARPNLSAPQHANR